MDDVEKEMGNLDLLCNDVRIMLPSPVEVPAPDGQPTLVEVPREEEEVAENKY